MVWDALGELIIWVIRVFTSKPKSSERDILTISVIIAGAFVGLGLLVATVLHLVSDVFRDSFVAIFTLTLIGVFIVFVTWGLYRLYQRDEEVGRVIRHTKGGKKTPDKRFTDEVEP